jgi:dihydrodipicolinate synthase/N-acetylneuraminate lyase
MRFRPSEAAIVAHFQAVAGRSPVPLIVYNIPYRTARGSAPQRYLSWRRLRTSSASSRRSAASTPTRRRS